MSETRSHYPWLNMQIRRAQPKESREVRRWIMERHYSGTAPPGYRVALEVLENGARVGAMLLGRPTARSLDQVKWLELTRMYFLDEAPRNIESAGLAMMRKWVRTWMPGVKALLAYSDPSHGHNGTVYEADGWAAFGRTAFNRVGWRNRPNRRPDEVPSRKIRWIRTP